jgi:hypothetical protein
MGLVKVKAGTGLPVHWRTVPGLRRLWREGLVRWENEIGLKGPKKTQQMLKLFAILPSSLGKGRPSSLVAGLADVPCVVTRGATDGPSLTAGKKE